jgi:hypothetical protein
MNALDDVKLYLEHFRITGGTPPPRVTVNVREATMRKYLGLKRAEPLAIEGVALRGQQTMAEEAAMSDSQNVANVTDAQAGARK